MKVRYLNRPVRILAALVLAALAVSPAWAQHRLQRPDRGPAYIPPSDCAPAPYTVPGMPYLDKDGKTVDPKGQPDVTQPPPATAPQIDPGSFVSAAGGGGDIGLASNVGYIDSAIPFTHFRLRYDSAYNNNRPDRATYFYAKCGCFGPADGNASGPPLPETSVDYQVISSYLEYALGERFSAFIDVPMRIINPDINANSAGLGDISFGAKYAFLYERCQVASFQMRVWIPTGDPDRGLGTDHVTLEPALLYNRRLSERLVLEAMIKDWIPIGGGDFAGNVLQYGVGLGYTVSDTGRMTVTPIAEVVGWTVLGGKEFLFPEGVTQDASGDTIVNAKLGVRFGFGSGRCDDGGFPNRSDLYLGYARALTGEVWYKDSFRIEYRVRF
jgi:hypothetical protein